MAIFVKVVRHALVRKVPSNTITRFNKGQRDFIWKNEKPKINIVLFVMITKKNVNVSSEIPCQALGSKDYMFTTFITGN